MSPDESPRSYQAHAGAARRPLGLGQVIVAVVVLVLMAVGIAMAILAASKGVIPGAIIGLVFAGAAAFIGVKTFRKRGGAKPRRKGAWRLDDTK